MLRKTTKFKRLLHSGKVEFLMEAHNGISAKIVEETGFEGIWGSGLAISAALGVRDNNEASWTQILDMVEFMSDASTIPILLDADTGYGNFNNVRRLVNKLEQRGVAAMCIEDKLFPKTNSFIGGEQQPLAEVDEFVGKIKAAKDTQQDTDFCVVARVEALIAGWGLNEAIRRAEAYHGAGADAILIHSKLDSAKEVLAFMKEWGGRCPVVIVPTKYYTTPAQVFEDAGISIVIWANQLIRSCISIMQENAVKIYQSRSLQMVEREIAPINEVFRLQGATELQIAEKVYLPTNTASDKEVEAGAEQSKSKDEERAEQEPDDREKAEVETALQSPSLQTGSKENGGNPPVIVIDLDCMTGLQTARIFASYAIPVIGIASNTAHFSCRTKACEKVLISNTDSMSLIHTLEELGPSLSQKAVLVPCADHSVLILSAHRRRLQKWFHIALPDPHVVDMLMDKIAFYRFAQENNLPIPGTFLLTNREEAAEAATLLAFPCILKPTYKSATWRQKTGAKAFKVESAQEFLALYDRCCNWADALIVQEWVPGSAASLYSCNCYFDATGEPLVTFCARKIRQWPPEAGTSTLGEEIRNDFVVDETLRLFKAANYRGLGYVEMKRDERTEKHYIIEPNVGRPTGRSAIAEAGGVEILYTQYCDLVGLPLPANREQKFIGAKWIHLRQDFRSAWYHWRRGELSIINWVKSLRGRKAYAVFSWTDPLPFYFEIRNKAIQVLRGRRRQKVSKKEVPLQSS